MTHAKRFFLYLVVVLGLLALAGGLPASASAQHLPKHLKDSHCSTLQHLKGVKYDKHLLRDLCGHDTALYHRMYNTVVGESHWQTTCRNSSDHVGYAQFMTDWANGNNNGHWVWNRYDGHLNIRMFYYFVTHPKSTGGWSNWAGH